MNFERIYSHQSKDAIQLGKTAIINLNYKTMGLFSGLTELAISPIKIVSKTFDNVINDDWEAEDAFTLGLTKVAKAVKDEAKEIDNSFEE